MVRIGGQISALPVRQAQQAQAGKSVERNPLFGQDRFEKRASSAQPPVGVQLPQLRFGEDIESVGVEPYVHPTHQDLVHTFVRWGTDNKTRNVPAVSISKYFSANGQEQSFTYGDLLNELRQSAAMFKEMGIGKGDRVAMAEMNTPEFLSDYFGGLAVGATMMPLNLLALQDEATKTQKLMHMVASPKSRALLIGEDSSFKAMESIATVQKLTPLRKVLGPVLERHVSGQPAKNILERVFRKTILKLASRFLSAEKLKDMSVILAEVPENLTLVTPVTRKQFRQVKPMGTAQLIQHPDPDATADVLFTSGTSGFPKGVALSHRNLVFTVDSLTEATEFIKPNDVTLMALPLFHIFGKAVLLTLLNKGSKVVMIPSLKDAMTNLPDVVKTIEAYNVTMLPAVPRFLELLVAHLEKNPQDIPRVQKLRVIISGGAPLKESTYNKLVKMIPGLEIKEGYGSSEGGINMLNMTGEKGYVGKLLPGVQAKISEDGELLLRSPGVSPGYVAGTASADADEVFGKDGWFSTGDIVQYDADKQMYKVIDRVSDFIKVSGERRPPGDFEEALLKTGLVLDGMALSYKPDRETELPVAVVTVKDPGVTEDKIKETLSALASDKQIAGWTIPKHIVVLNRPQLPHGFLAFKRQYAAARDFVKAAVEAGILTFGTEPSTTPGGRPVNRTLFDPAALNAFVDAYRYIPKKK